MNTTVPTGLPQNLHTFTKRHRMDQDGRGENTGTQDFQGAHEVKGGESRPKSMVLRLFELNGVSTESVLVPFVASYEDALQLSLSIFRRFLKPGMDEDTVVLKFPYKCTDNTCVWACLDFNMDYHGNWTQALSIGVPIVEIGVFFSEEVRAATKQRSGATSKKIMFKFANMLDDHWHDRPPVPLPSTYKECIRKARETTNEELLRGKLLLPWHARAQNQDEYLDNNMILKRAMKNNSAKWEDFGPVQFAEALKGTETPIMVDIYLA